MSDLPFAVMIDNIEQARPHSGLGAADVVYEEPAEGGIPRLLAVFLRDAQERIGPVRSARHYFVYTAAEYGTPLVHIGSSPQGFVAIEETGIVSVDESKGADGFIRDPSRRAPHNAYITAAGIRDELKKRGLKLKVSTAGLQFGAAQPGTEKAESLRILYPGGERYVVSYAYDAASGRYLRSMDGVPHRDGVSGDQYGGYSVLVQYVPVEPIPGDDAGRLEVYLVGSGRATLFVQGTQVPLEWSKSSIYVPTTFRRQDGKAFLLPSGQVWIQVIPTESQVTIA